MALFPAYGSQEENGTKPKDLLVWKDDDVPLSEAAEVQLLTSDTEEQESEINTLIEKETTHNSRPQLNITQDFYLDSKSDYGNLNVSTLYYPGRPEYRCKGGDNAVGVKYIKLKKAKRKQRYFTCCIQDEPDAPAITERADAYQRLLAENPHDPALWEKFIDFQEWCGTAEGALLAAEAAAARLPEHPGLRARLLDAQAAALPPPARLQRLRELLAAERDPRARLPLWERLLRELAAEPGDAGAVTAAAALADTRAAPGSYPRLLYAAGAQLRAAGLWERLVLLIELAVGMNHSVDAIPQPLDPHRLERVETRLIELEDKVTSSGLPLSAVWVRVERARAAAHWRPASTDRPAPADPQRSPHAHDVADLLQPLVAEEQLLQLSVRLLMLAKVPLLPGTDWAARAFGGTDADCAEALLPLVWAADELPVSHPARAQPAVGRRLLALALDPPHYFSDESGYLGWVDALWDACCAAARGAARTALLCWRLRWLRAQLLLTDAGEDEGASERERVRRAARGALRRLRCAEPLAVAELAKVERAAGDGARAARTAELALRSALLADAGPPEHALYVARIVGEVSPEVGAGALVSAVLGRPPTTAPPAPAERAAALQRCEERCQELERLLTGDEEDPCAALLPGAGEWARARAALAQPARRRELLVALPAAVRVAPPPARRSFEEAAEALVRAAASDGRVATAARALVPLFPYNAYLALASSGAPLWAWQAQGQDERLGALAARGDVVALAGVMPALVRALAAPEPLAPAPATEAAVRALRRATSGVRGARAGALLWAIRLELEARAPHPRLPHALYAALDAAPVHKWLYVRGAAWCGGAAEALEDALLERQLRLHALRDELRAPAPPAPPATPADEDGCE